MTRRNDRHDERAYVAALTGDLVGDGSLSSDADPLRRVKTLKQALSLVEEAGGSEIVSSFAIFRGDGFQGIVRPSFALTAALMIRVALRARGTETSAASALDVRIAVGIGDVLHPLGENVAESDGTALRRSGPLLDEMKGTERRLLFSTPWRDIDGELNTECLLLDAILARWSRGQAEAAWEHLLLGKTQKEAADTLGISQPAISQRLKAANIDAMAALQTRYHLLVRSHISSEPNDALR